MMRCRRTVCLAIVIAGTVPTGSSSAAPTCAGVAGEVHGHHVVADYVTGVGHDTLDWPPVGQSNAQGGAALPGGPGPGFHFPNGFAPGASFCLAQSNSPGGHLGG